MSEVIQFSNQSLIFFSFSVVMVMESIMLGYFILYPDTKGLKPFMLGNLLLLAFYTLLYIDGFSGILRFPVMVNLSEASTAVCWMIAFKDIVGKRVKPLFYGVLLTANVLLTSYFFYINNNVVGRRVATSLIVFIILVEATYHIAKTAKDNKYHSFLFSGSSIVLFAAITFIRTVYRFIVPIQFKTVFDNNPSITFFVLIMLIFAVFMNFAIAFLNMDRLVNKIRFLSDTDPLTKIFNRRYFVNRLDELVELLRRKHEGFVIAMFDLDNFKSVNDTYGHKVGDEVLIEFAEFLTHELRKIDIVARYGGEEFIALIRTNDNEVAHQVLKRIHQSVKERTYSSAKLNITISGGAVLITDEHRNMSTDDMIEIADKRLYYAKETGKDRIIINALDMEL